jgi:hypothetical protein
MRCCLRLTNSTFPDSAPPHVCPCVHNHLILSHPCLGLLVIDAYSPHPLASRVHWVFRGVCPPTGRGLLSTTWRHAGATPAVIPHITLSHALPHHSCTSRSLSHTLPHARARTRLFARSLGHRHAHQVHPPPQSLLCPASRSPHPPTPVHPNESYPPPLPPESCDFISVTTSSVGNHST